MKERGDPMKLEDLKAAWKQRRLINQSNWRAPQ